MTPRVPSSMRMIWRPDSTYPMCAAWQLSELASIGLTWSDHFQPDSKVARPTTPSPMFGPHLARSRTQWCRTPPRWWQHDSCFGVSHLGNPPSRSDTQAEAPTGGRIGGSQFCLSDRVASPMAIMADPCKPYQHHGWIRAGCCSRGSSYRIRVSRVRCRPWLRRPC